MLRVSKDYGEPDLNSCYNCFYFSSYGFWRPPRTWMNPMKGFGFGVTPLASAYGSSQQSALGQAAAEAARAAAAAAGGS